MQMLHGFASHYEIQQEVALIQVNRGMPNESIKGKCDFHGITHHCDGQQEIAHAKTDEDMQNESIKAKCKGMYDQPWAPNFKQLEQYYGFTKNHVVCT